ncbi:hypothetical protein [Campylobacter sp. MG1]|uniref:hypothetical protein n=1 Tax=Campylobacter sp. MG1 TaxID=2976332 RepID=UPI00226CC9E3|nr:hypothetical protein [Campylobacter sp. MG1]
MNKEIVKIVSKQGLIALIKQVFNKREIYTDTNSFKICLYLDEFREFYLEEIKTFEKIKNISPNKNIKNINLIPLYLYVRLYFLTNYIIIDFFCYIDEYDINYNEFNIKVEPNSTEEQIAKLIMNLIDEVNKKQDIFEIKIKG